MAPLVAFLIAAHRDPAMLRRLVDRLQAPWSAAFVHIDARVDVAPFSAALGERRATLLPSMQRTPIWWCDAGLVRAACALMRAALSTPSIERLFFMSGADYPIRPLEQLLQLPGDQELLRVDRRLDPSGDSWFDRTAYRRHFMRGDVLNPRSGPPWVVRISERVSRRLKRRPLHLPVYHGPSWWSLTRPTALGALHRLEADPRLGSWFRWARCPEELLFQTLVKADPQARIAMDLTSAAPPIVSDSTHATHYVDFRDAHAGSPRLLQLEDFEALAQSSAPFARKFDSRTSAPLLDRIDAELLGT